MELALREKLLIGAALGVGALVYFAPSGSSTVEPARGPEPAAHVQRVALDTPGPRGAMAQLAHRVVTAAAAGALFAAHSWYTPPPPPPPPPSRPVVVAPSVPTAPPLPYEYMGSYPRDGGKPVFFLTRGDRTYDVQVGDTLDGVYSFDGLSGSDLVFTYKPLKIRQTLSVTGAP
jgi:hypothetical protein